MKGTHVWITDHQIAMQVTTLLGSLGVPGVVVGTLVQLSEAPIASTISQHQPETASLEHTRDNWADRPLIWVHTLGPLTVCVNGSAIPPQQWRQVGAGSLNTKKLFAYLLHCRNFWLRRGEIQDAVWPNEHDEDKLAQRFHRTLTGIKAMFNTAAPDLHILPIVTRDRRYRLSDAFLWRLDTDTFSEIIRQADDHANKREVDAAMMLYERALEMYAGDYMTDVPEEDGDPENVSRANWWRERRGQLKAERQHARRKLAGLYLAKERTADVIKLWSDALDEPGLDPDDLRALAPVALQALRCENRFIEGLQTVDRLAYLLRKEEDGLGDDLKAVATELLEQVQGRAK